MKTGNTFLKTILILTLCVTCFGVGTGTGSVITSRLLNAEPPAEVSSQGKTPEKNTQENNSPKNGENKQNTQEKNDFENEFAGIAAEFAVSSSSSASSSDAVSVVKGTANSVVSINVLQDTTYNFGYWQVPSQTQSAGSGVIFSEDDGKIYILTNNHVVDRATGVTISIDDENTAEANFVGSDANFDLAVISVNKDKLKDASITNYTVAEFGNSDRLEVGERVVAIGNAYGEGKSATQGIISALGKQITTSEGSTLDVIQTDAAINPGNSGGALVNASSEVIGINTAKLSSYGVEGMGYSIPSNIAKTIVERIMRNKDVKETYLGIMSGITVTEDIKASYNLPTLGVYVGQVAANSPAAIAGVMSDDIIVSFGGGVITSTEDLVEAIGKTKPGDSVKITVYRGGQSKPVTVTAVMKEKQGGTNF
ncbi:MAG: trypsin-like peptidase domain-containing protein [Clostridiales bacterium]|jgi:serine protease Do|nr:trypsin-like peptidase domain-containing protein [Clostridiales bacterium]